MPGGGSKPGERRGGRQKGSLNLSTKELQAQAQRSADELLEGLTALARDETQPAKVRIKAAKIVLDLGYGKVS
jgi:hypothetical protein